MSEHDDPHSLQHLQQPSREAVGSGILLIDKARGITSHDVVAAIRSRLHVRRVGHAGTLDPMATGLLLVGFGHATRLLNYIVEHAKTYEATIRFGQSTTTDDAEGEVVRVVSTALVESGGTQPVGARDSVVISPELLEATISNNFLGDIEQVPSTYSAIKVAGRRAYDLARQGEHVELKPRSITVSEFTVLDMRQAPTAERRVVDADVRVQCSAGTYIRALARDLGVLLGTGGHLTALRRTRVGDFSIEDPRLVGSRCESHTVVNKHGQTTVRRRAAVPDDDILRRSALTLFDAVRSTMPTLALHEHEVADLRFGRRIDRHIDGIVGAFDPATHEVIAILQPDGSGGARSTVVFPEQVPEQVFPADK